MKPITLLNNQSKAISIIRVISMLLIIMCHILQGINNEFAWWLNIGVQIFLFMSGFLTANSFYINNMEYIKKRILRIIVPYWIFLILIIPIYYIIEDITLFQIIIYFLGLQGFIKYKIPGLEHLWFISVILVCYIIALYMNNMRYKIENCTNKEFWIKVIVFSIFIQIIMLPIDVVYGVWVITFTTGYFIGFRYNFNIPKLLIILFAPIALITTLLRIFFVYISPLNDHIILKIFDALYLPWSKMVLGSFLFMLMYNFIVKKVSIEKDLNTKIKYFEKISYEIYLIHQIIILGPLSLLFYTRNLYINILIILIIILVSSMILNIISNKVQIFINSKINKLSNINNS